MTAYNYSYHILDKDMYLSPLFQSKELKDNILLLIEEIDSEEKKIIDAEDAYVTSYSKQWITAVKISTVVICANIGVSLSMLFTSLSPITSVGLINLMGLVAYLLALL